MAYVAITQQLRNDITNHIDNMANAEANTLPDPTPLFQELAADPVIVNTVDEIAWGEFRDLEPRLERFNKEVRGLLVYSCATADGHDEIEYKHVASYSSFGLAKHGVYYDPIVIQLNAIDHPKVAELRGVLEARHEASIRWNKVSQQILNFVGKCKSLNEAVKLWPDVVRYIPKEYLARLEKKTEKPKVESDAVQALKDVDTDLANASIVLARMAGVKA